MNENVVNRGDSKLISGEEITKILSQEGVEIPAEYAGEIVEKIKEEIKSPVEVNENSLEMISGGASSWMKNNWGKIMAAVGVTIAAGATIAAVKHFAGKIGSKMDSSKESLKKAQNKTDEINNSINNVNEKVGDLVNKK